MGPDLSALLHAEPLQRYTAMLPVRHKERIVKVLDCPVLDKEEVGHHGLPTNVLAMALCEKTHNKTHY